ncbi:hypothetical protein IFU04_25710 [Pseudomonas syringae]|nr:hypothetical protein [Pseudomonas syringae]
MKVERFRTTFVEFIPDDLEDGVLYVSMRYRTVSHLCACGCRQEVPLSISPTAWQLTFNGEVSLSPSVGNWSFPCRSHYFIRGGAVDWSGEMSDKAIQSGRAHVAARKEQFYEKQNTVPKISRVPAEEVPSTPPQKGGLLAWLKRLFQ